MITDNTKFEELSIDKREAFRELMECHYGQLGPLEGWTIRELRNLVIKGNIPLTKETMMVVLS